MKIMEALDILEKRIDTLTRMVGNVSEINLTDGTNVVDSLQSAQLILQDAVKNREQLSKMIDRSEELENYMDPNFMEESQKRRTKEVYLNAVAPDMIATFEQLEEIKKLEPALGAEYFRNIPNECTDKLKEFSTDNAEFAQQTELIEESLIMMMKRYGELQSNLLSSLGDMNKRLEAVEDRLQKRKQEELLKDLPPTTAASDT